MEKTLEQRISTIEKEIAELKAQFSVQPVGIKLLIDGKEIRRHLGNHELEE
jgi:hypothetical protein